MRAPFKLALVALVVGVVCFHIQGSNPRPGTVMWVGGAALFVACVSFFYGLFSPIEDELVKSIHTLKRGVPSPEEIHQRFTQSQGRQPTVEEVAALHQMATSQSKRALVTLGAILGGAAIGLHELHHG